MNSLPLPDSNEEKEGRCSHCGAAIRLTARSGETSCAECGKPVSEEEVPTAGASGTLPDEADMTFVLSRESSISLADDSDVAFAGQPDQTAPQAISNLSFSAAASHVRSIGRFEIRQRLGQGAFGVVYRAYDPVLDRDVALKVPKLVTHDEHRLDSFFREAKAAARLRHPNIVAVFESGKVDDFYYIATEFVEGKPLSEWLEKEHPPIRDAVQWVQELAGAVGYAHGEGIVHRDIKPANIMIGKGGRPQLMDFGLAKSQRNRNDGITDGSVVGTPAYMSPEQARGEVQLTGPLSDQYSLGAVLYKAITGQQPYAGDRTFVVSLVANEQHTPPAPTAINPAIPKDLEACCVKAMHKTPAQRYASSQDFSADLRRWLRGEPVHARPISSAERLWRWCRGNPMVASLATAIALILIVGSIIATTAALGFRSLAERERIAAEKAETTLSDSYTNSGLVASDTGKPAQAVLWFANAAVQGKHDPDREYANRIRVRNWSRELPLPISVPPNGGRLKAISFHADGRYLLSLSLAGKIAIWDVLESRQFPLPADLQDANAAAWSVDGKWLALGKSDHVALLSFPDGERQLDIIHPGAIAALEFSHDGERLAIGGESVRVWNIPLQRFASPPLQHPQMAVKLLFNKQGNRLFTAAQDNLVRVFSIDDEQHAEPLFPPLPNLIRFAGSLEVVAPVLIDNDHGLLTKGGAIEAVWWNAETGEKIRSLPVKSTVLNLASTADGQRFVVCDFTEAQVWDVAAEQAVKTSPTHANFIYSAAFTSDGKILVTVSADRNAGLWDAATGETLGQALAHQNEVDLLAMSPDSCRFATAQIDGLVRIWELPSPELKAVRQIPIDSTENYLTITSDGRSITPSGWNTRRDMKSVRFYDVATGAADPCQIQLSGCLNDVTAAPDGTRFVTLSSVGETPIELVTKEPGLIEFWSRSREDALFPPVTTSTEPIGAAWSSDDQTIAVICAGGQILVFDAQTGKLRYQADQGAMMIPRYMVRKWIRFAPNSQTFVTWGMGNGARVWDTRTGSIKYDLEHDERCHDVTFSAQGELIATMSMDATVGIWNARTGARLKQLRHPDWRSRFQLWRPSTLSR